METTETQHAQARDLLLAYYYMDLSYIRDFQRWRKGQIPRSDYLDQVIWSFRGFLKEFQVIRRIEEGHVGDVLDLTAKWICGPTPGDVDGFAQDLMKHGPMRGARNISLASKVLFLNDPVKILPYDGFVTDALGPGIDSYASYLVQVAGFTPHNLKAIKSGIALIEDQLLLIERWFREGISDIETVRQNRYIDKLLWSIGREKELIREGKRKSRKQARRVEAH